jgi:hypothetical protein
MSKLGGDFPPERFVRTPIKTLRNLLAYVSHALKVEQNTQASSIAHLGQHITHLAYMVNGVKETPEDRRQFFLPWPNLKELGTPEGDTRSLLSDKTKEILLDLLAKRLMPPHAVHSLLEPPPQGPQ